MKNQWARDDPAFVVVLLYLLLISVVSWCIGFGRCVPGLPECNGRGHRGPVVRKSAILLHTLPPHIPSSSIISYVSLALYVFAVDFALIGGVCATACWWLANTYLQGGDDRSRRQVSAMSGVLCMCLIV
mgnify:CR=1 FL=1